jgi:hypothetical protein
VRFLLPNLRIGQKRSSFKVTQTKSEYVCVRVYVYAQPFLVVSLFKFWRFTLGCFPILTSIRNPNSSDRNAGHL